MYSIQMYHSCIQFPPLPETIDGEEHYENTAICDSAIVCHYCMPLCYLTEWKGYEETGEGLKWVSTDNINASDAIADFHALNPDKPGPVKNPTTSDYHSGRIPDA